MNIFEKRLVAPATTNKYYIHSSAGGLNDCIKIGAKSVLPNCVGYAFGRVYELLESYPKLSKNNAEDWWNYKDGYDRGITPKLGAVACFKKGNVRDGSDGAGHVCIVESINDDGTIVTSNSAYGGTRFYLKEIKPPYNLIGYDFQGFIYPPYPWYKNELTENKKTDLPKKTIEEIAKDVIKGLYGNGIERKRKLEEKGSNYNEVQNKVNEILGSKIDVENKKEEVKQEFKVGDKVSFDYLFTDSYASTKKPYKSLIHSGVITKIYEGRKAPYLINNGSGFLSEEYIISKL